MGKTAPEEEKLSEIPPGSYLPSSHSDHSPVNPLVLLAEKGQSLARLAGEADGFSEKGKGLGERAGQRF